MGKTSLSYVTGVERGAERREKGEGLGRRGKGNALFSLSHFTLSSISPRLPFFAPATQAKLVGCVEHLAKFC